MLHIKFHRWINLNWSFFCQHSDKSFTLSQRHQRLHTGETVWLTGENPFFTNTATNHSLRLKVLQDINELTREKNHCVTYWRKPFFLLTMRKIFRFVLKSFKISTNLHGRKSVTNWTKSFFLPTLRKIIRLDWNLQEGRGRHEIGVRQGWDRSERGVRIMWWGEFGVNSRSICGQFRVNKDSRA